MRRRRRARARAKHPQASQAGSSGPAEQLPERPTDSPAARTDDSPEAHFDEGVELLQAAVQQVGGEDAAPRPAQRGNGRRDNGRRTGGGESSAGTAAPDVETEGLDADSEDRDTQRRRGAEQRRRAEERRRRARARRTATGGPPTAATAPADPVPAEQAPAPAAEADEADEAPVEAPPIETDDTASGEDDSTSGDAPVEAPPAEADDTAAPLDAVLDSGALDSEPESPAAAAVLESPAPPSSPTVVEATRRPKPARPPRRGKHSRRERIFVATVVVLVLAATAILSAVTVIDRDGGRSGTAGGGPAELTFRPISLAAGATVERTWTLRGPDGSRFEGALTFRNVTGEPVEVSHTEVIPKSLAGSVDDIDFDPVPVVIERDPVVRFDITVPADETVTAAYRIDVDPDGADESRLEAWADEMERESRARSDTTTTTTTTSTTTTTTTTTSTPPSGSGGDSGGGGGTSNEGAAPVPTPGVTPAPSAPAPAPGPPPPPPADPNTGTIVIAVRSVGGTGTFTFTGPNGTLQVATSGSPGTGQSAPMTVSPGGWVWWQASPPPGWRFDHIECSDQGQPPELRSTVDPKNRRVVFNVQAGELLLCTWTNQRT